jgi:anti-sigma factor (TIGR02949 family)
MTEPHRFTCDDVFRRLDDYLDRELSEAEMRLVAEHLDTCAQCAAEHRFEARVLESIKGKLGKIKAPDLLLKRISKALDAARRQHPE